MSNVERLITSVLARLVWRERLGLILIALTVGAALLLVSIGGSWLPPFGFWFVVLLAIGAVGVAVLGLTRIETVTTDRAALLIDAALGLKERVVSFVALAADLDTGRREFLLAQIEPQTAKVTAQQLVPYILPRRFYLLVATLVLTLSALLLLFLFKPDFRRLNAPQIAALESLLQTESLPAPVVEKLQNLTATLENAAMNSGLVQSEISAAADAVAAAAVGGTEAAGQALETRGERNTAITPTATPTATPTPTVAAQSPKEPPPDTDVQNSTSGGEPKGESEKKSGAKENSDPQQDGQGKQAEESQGAKGAKGKNQGEQSQDDGNEGSGEGQKEGKGKEGEGNSQGQKGASGSKQSGAEGHQGESEGQEQGEQGAQSSNAEKKGLEKAKEALEQLKKEAQQAQENSKSGDGASDAKKDGKEDGKNSAGDKKSPESKDGKQGQQKGSEGSQSEGSDGKSPDSGAKQGQEQKSPDKPGAQSPEGDPRAGKGEGNKPPPVDSRKNAGKGQGKDAPDNPQSDPNQKDNPSRQGVTGNRNEKARDFSELPGGDAGGGIKGEKGFKDVSIKDTAPEKFDPNFTGKEEEKAEGNSGSGPRTTLEDVKLAKPDPVKDSQVQRVPLEYLEMLR